MKIKISPVQIQYYFFLGAFFAMPMGTSPFTILGGCALILWIFSGEFYRCRYRYLKEAWFLPVVALTALVWIGLIWSPDPSGIGFKFAKKTHYWLYAFAVASVLFNGKSAENLIKAFLTGLSLNALVGFLQYLKVIPIISKFGTVYTGFHGGYNTLAILLVLGILTASFYFRMAEGKKAKGIYFFLMLVYFFHLIILTGRGGYLTFAILSPIIAYNVSPRKSLIAILIIYILVIITMSFSPVVQDRFTVTINAIEEHFDAKEDFVSGKKYSGPLDRIYMWRWAIHLFKEHPFIGVGTGGYKQSVLASGGDIGIAHPHNNILHMAASYGVLGLFAFAWLFWVLLKAGWQNRHGPVGFFIFSSSLVILVGGFTDTHILDAGGAFLLAVTTGLMTTLPNKRHGLVGRPHLSDSQ